MLFYLSFFFQNKILFTIFWIKITIFFKINQISKQQKSKIAAKKMIKTTSLKNSN